jgi:hypothetical protein
MHIGNTFLKDHSLFVIADPKTKGMKMYIINLFQKQYALTLIVYVSVVTTSTMSLLVKSVLSFKGVVVKNIKT